MFEGFCSDFGIVGDEEYGVVGGYDGGRVWDWYGVEYLVVFWKIEKVLGVMNKNDFMWYNVW